MANGEGQGAPMAVHTVLVRGGILGGFCKVPRGVPRPGVTAKGKTGMAVCKFEKWGL